jgi:uncharacterized protein
MKFHHSVVEFRGSLGTMIARPRILQDISKALRRSRAVALIGPRQCGKTTLARQIVPGDSLNYFDLEDPASLARLDQPMVALSRLRGTVVIDEIQRRPDLFPILRVLLDRRPLPARFLILGSASPELLRQSSESLAGRLETVPVAGLSVNEINIDAFERHWQRGGFPLSYTARNEEDSATWRQQFIQTFLERDLPQLGINIPAPGLKRFWSMCAHAHGGIWSSADPARSLGIGESTVRRYLDLFTHLLVVRQLQPWHENLGKRQVKSPKVYVRDSGLLHSLLGITSFRMLAHHPKLGASWEGYVIEEVLKVVQPDEAHFWATHQGAELDLMLTRNGRRVGVEIKYADAPGMTPSIRHALADLELQRITILYPGDRAYQLDRKVHVMPFVQLAENHESLFSSQRSRRRA